MSNPFEILLLDPAASEEEVVRQAGRLRQRTPEEAALSVIRQAVQVLTSNVEERLLHQLLTHPHPCYHWPALDRFTAAFRRFPPVGASVTLATLQADLAEIARLIEVDGPEPAREAQRWAIEALRCRLAE